MKSETESVIEAAASSKRGGADALEGLVKWLDACEKELGHKRFLDLMPNNIYGRRHALKIAGMLRGE